MADAPATFFWYDPCLNGLAAFNFDSDGSRVTMLSVVPSAPELNGTGTACDTKIPQWVSLRRSAASCTGVRARRGGPVLQLHGRRAVHQVRLSRMHAARQRTDRLCRLPPRVRDDRLHVGDRLPLVRRPLAQRAWSCLLLREVLAVCSPTTVHPDVAQDAFNLKLGETLDLMWAGHKKNIKGGEDLRSEVSVGAHDEVCARLRTRASQYRPPMAQATLRSLLGEGKTYYTPDSTCELIPPVPRGGVVWAGPLIEEGHYDIYEQSFVDPRLPDRRRGVL